MYDDKFKDFYYDVVAYTLCADPSQISSETLEGPRSTSNTLFICLIVFGFLIVIAFYFSIRFIYMKTQRENAAAANAEKYKTEKPLGTERALVEDKLEGGTLAE